MSKICFMFLTRDNITRPDIWEPFFHRADRSKYSIRCHPKFRSRVTQPFLKDNIIDNAVDTQWGKYSLVEAELALLREGLTDHQNQMFILLSEKCCPLWDLDTIHNYLNRNQYSFIGIHQNKTHVKKLITNNATLSNYVLHPQWIILNRTHAEYFVTNQEKHRQIFQNVPIPDEHYFGSIVMREKLEGVVFRSKTYANIKNCHGQTFKKLDKSILTRLRKNGFLFARKIGTNTQIIQNELFV